MKAYQNLREGALGLKEPAPAVKEKVWELYFSNRNFSREIARRAAAMMMRAGPGETPDEVLAREANQLAFDRHISYDEAVAAIKRTRPELWESYAAYCKFGHEPPTEQRFYQS